MDLKELKATKISTLADRPCAPTRDPILSLTATNKASIFFIYNPRLFGCGNTGVFETFNPLPTLLWFKSVRDLNLRPTRPVESLNWQKLLILML
jgi:hypothetical protein